MIVGMLPTTGIRVYAAGSVTIDETNFPDEDFCQFVKRFDKNNDDELSTEELKSVTVMASYANDKITSLKGVEYFTELKELYCFSNKITFLDVSKNTKLEILNCSFNELDELDVSHNTSLTELDCQDNHLTTLDVSKNTLLTILRCHENQLQELDISKNKDLVNVSCDANKLSSLDVSSNTLLEILQCSDNNLATLDVSKNPHLKQLWCNRIKLNTLDVSNNPNLEVLVCSENNLTELDVSNNTKLYQLGVSENRLSSIDISMLRGLNHFSCSKNSIKTLDVSYNTSLKNLSCSDNGLETLKLGNLDYLLAIYIVQNNLEEVDITGCPMLMDVMAYGACTTSDTDIDYRWERKIDDEYYSYRLDADYGVKIIRDVNIDNKTFPDKYFRLFVIGEYDVNDDGVLSASEAAEVTDLYCEDSGIQSLRGIEAFINLQRLSCSGNQMESLALYNPDLMEIACYDNQLVSLDVTHLPNLSALYCQENQLGELDVTKNEKLQNFICFSNRMEELDISKNKGLETLSCENNDIIKLNVGSCPLLVNAVIYGEYTADTSATYQSNAHEWLRTDLTTNIITAITELRFEIETPKAGDAPYTQMKVTTVPEGAFSEKGVETFNGIDCSTLWRVSEGGTDFKNMEEGAVFEAGKVYKNTGILTVPLGLLIGFKQATNPDVVSTIASDVKLYINGKLVETDADYNMLCEGEAPDETTKLDETTKKPDETTKAPDETTKKPDETTKAPDETTKKPDETTKAPGETTKKPDETTKVPDETTKAPDETIKSEETSAQAETTTKNGSGKASQTLTVKTKKKSVKAAKLKKKKRTLRKVITVSNAQGTVTYKKVKKGSSVKLTINKKTGKITVKKGTKKGIYKIKVKVTSRGNAEYLAATKVVTIKVKVK